MSASDIIATASLVVAALAFGIAVWQLRLSRKHNSLSVKPHLTWNMSTMQNVASLNVTYSLSNNGIGPAFVRECYFSLDGNHFKSPDPSQSEIDSLVKQLLPEGWNCTVVAQGLPGINSAIVAGKDMIIAELAVGNDALTDPQKLNQLLDRVSFSVVYEDLYGKQDVFKSEQHRAASI